MEWVLTTARTVEEAKDAALDQLGVDHDDAEFEVLEEPRQGLFGRMRGDAKVRARVRPTTPRAKVERRPRKSSASSGGSSGGGRGSGGKASDAPPASSDEAPVDVMEPAVPGDGEAPRPRTPRRPRAAEPASSNKEQTVTEITPEAEAAEAAAFLEGLANAFAVEGAQTTTIVEGDDVEVLLDGNDVGLLIGPRGQTLVSIQDLTRTVANRAGSARTTTLRIDIGGYRERRRAALSQFTARLAEEVISTGQARALEPMTAADRKVVHDTAGGIDGVSTRSEGEDADRYVVLYPDSGV